MKVTEPSRHRKQRRRSPPPLPYGAKRAPGPLRQRPNGEGRLMRRPLRHRVVESSRPPSCSRSPSRFGLVMMAMVGGK